MTIYKIEASETVFYEFYVQTDDEKKAKEIVENAYLEWNDYIMDSDDYQIDDVGEYVGEEENLPHFIIKRAIKEVPEKTG